MNDETRRRLEREDHEQRVVEMADRIGRRPQRSAKVAAIRAAAPDWAASSRSAPMSPLGLNTFVAVTQMLEREDAGTAQWAARLRKLTAGWTAEDLEAAAVWFDRRVESAQRHAAALRAYVNRR